MSSEFFMTCQRILHDKTWQIQRLFSYRLSECNVAAYNEIVNCYTTPYGFFTASRMVRKVDYISRSNKLQ